MAKETIQLRALKKEDVPADLRAETYFDFAKYPFEHQALFEQTNSVCTAIFGIHDYAVKWLAGAIASKRSAAKAFKNTTPHPAQTFGQFELLIEEGATFAPAYVLGGREGGACYTAYIAKGAKIIGACIDLENGSVYVGEGATVEFGAGVKGPVIIGRKTEIRQASYLRGDCIIGNEATIRGEIKNAVLMDKANCPHVSYQGDSVCGYMTHFAEGAGTANNRIYAGLVDRDKRPSLTVECGGKVYDLGSSKLGMCMGDFSQMGGNAVADPGTFFKPWTIAYSVARINKGFYGPREILKNKPLEHGVIERAPLRPTA